VKVTNPVGPSSLQLAEVLVVALMQPAKVLRPVASALEDGGGEGG
jgi:hypothetical protein